MPNIQPYKEKTILKTGSGEEIIIDKPVDEVDKAMGDKGNDWLKLTGIKRNIRKSIIVDYYPYNITDELEFYIEEEFPDIKSKLKEKYNKRLQEGFAVNKNIINNIANRIYGYNQRKEEEDDIPVDREARKKFEKLRKDKLGI